MSSFSRKLKPQQKKFLKWLEVELSFDDIFKNGNDKSPSWNPSDKKYEEIDTVKLVEKILEKDYYYMNDSSELNRLKTNYKKRYENQ